MTLQTKAAVAATLLAAALLAGCSKQESASDSASPAKESKAVAAKEEPVKGDELFSAPEKFGRLRCGDDAKVAGQPDVLGVQMGMPFDDALMAIRCQLKEVGHYEFMADTIGAGTRGIVDRQGLKVQVGRRMHACDDKVLKSSRPHIWEIKCNTNQISYQNVTETIDVVSPGLPDAQKVVGIWRSQVFKDGEGPAVQAAVDALKAKYGPPTKEEASGATVVLYWLKSADGSEMTVRRQSECEQALSTSLQNSQFNGACGRTIHAKVYRATSNTLLALEIGVAMIDPVAAIDVGDKLTAYVQSAKADRDQREADKAKSMDDVKL